jgi:NAD(P)-dependent dehydrogenase (short-subunit alcohol dehydrogenase family)
MAESCSVRIDGSTFLVTGGASGLGRATVEMLAAHGAQVVIADVNRAAGEALATGLGPHARYVPTDVSKEEDVRAALQVALQTDGTTRLGGVVNAAGVIHAEKVVGREGSHSLDAFGRVIQINLIGTFNVIRLVAAALSSLPPTESGERGVIVCTASVAAFEGQIGQAAYSASKGGVASMTLPIARELARYGIRVVSIAPGIFDTPMLAALPEPARQSLGEQVPFPPRLGRPAEYAALVKHIMENEMLNGNVIRLDGALRMGPK